MGDLFFNKIAGVVIGGILIILVITELGHMLVKSHAPEELTVENTIYPVDWAALEGGPASAGEAVVEGPTDYGLLLAAADAGAGERIARRCQACHTFENGGADGTGPHLWGVVGRAVASAAGFSYSGALNELGGSWGYEELDAFLERPAGYAPGTNMTFAGLRNEEQRMDLIAYLRSLSDSPMALPDPLPAPGEAMDAEAIETAMDDAATQADAAVTDMVDAVEPVDMPDGDMAAPEDQPAEDTGH
ncbi:c-type cytochrome [Maricaulis sp.]|uniref:c-type cytochrome n=1 Tax=Maricaulis sp. TaxID=1486257 RepID=UPI003A8E1F44